MAKFVAIDSFTRFERSYTPVTESGCWIWLLRDKHHGYGQLRVGEKRVAAHRYSYEYFKGPIPFGLTIDHLCRVSSCVNPDHLEAVSRKVNMRRARKRFCVKGHERPKEHLESNPTIPCKICARIYKKEWMRNKRKKARARAIEGGE